MNQRGKERNKMKKQLIMSKDAAASYISKRYKMEEFEARKLYDELQNFKEFTE